MWCLVMFRRIQQNRNRSSFSDRPTTKTDLGKRKIQISEIHFRRGEYLSGSQIRSFHNFQP
jgi:hypothetical protein